jgi:hypothetical protein
MYGPDFGRAITACLLIAIVLAAALAIGLEHLLIWLWHHVSIKWS